MAWYVTERVTGPLVLIAPFAKQRNYEARNILKEMKTGDRLLYYHSSCKVPGIAGEAVVTQEATPDETQFDPKHPYYDAKATRETPRWVQVQVKFVAKFPTYVSLEELREIHRQSGGPLAEMDLFRRSRLSVQRVRQSEFEYIRTLANRS